MAVITESEIRKRLKDQDLKSMKVYEVPKNTIVTPSAKSFLTDHNIQLQYVDEAEKSESAAKQERNDAEIKPSHRYRTLCGGFMDAKPEYMTALYGNLLVYKDHKRIIFRGKIDSLESKLIEAQIAVMKLNMQKLADDLQEILDFVRNLLRCEVLGEKAGEFRLQGMGAPELREISHHPQKYFGFGHFIPDYKMGEPIVILNALRSAVRETELAAYQAFKKEDGSTEQEEIILALNRLSSLFWIMMFKAKTGQYKP
ncbi:MAG: cobalamin adenosyltransferase [Ectobacillus sp.]